MILQETSDEARFWGAFGLYAFVTSVCDICLISLVYTLRQYFAILLD